MWENEQQKRAGHRTFEMYGLKRSLSGHDTTLLIEYSNVISYVLTSPSFSSPGQVNSMQQEQKLTCRM
jgi:hypothetical protein